MEKKRRLALLMTLVCVCAGLYFVVKPYVPGEIQIIDEEVALNSGTFQTPGMQNAKKINTERLTPYTESVMNDESKLLFVSGGDAYQYAITSDGKEVFSIKTTDGEYIDTLMGGGSYVTVDAVTGNFVAPIGLASFEESMEDGDGAVTVSYTMSDGSVAYNKYVFHDSHVSVEATIRDIPNFSTVAGAMLYRDFVNDYMDAEKKITTNWVFPENGDFPYKESDSIMTSYFFDKDHKLYSFVRGEDGARQVMFEEYGQDNIPVTVNNAVDEYTIVYDLVFENMASTQDSDYIALFRGRNSEFAAGVTPLRRTESNVAIYDAHALDFNFNVTNLEDNDINALINYTVYDYYGNVLAGNQESYAVAVGADVNIPVHIENNGSGMMFIDFSVSCGQSSYREFFPFAVLDSYTYTNNGNSPFGLSGVRFGEYEPNDDTVWIAENIGAANVRVCLSEPDYVADSNALLAKYLGELTANNINVNGQYLLMDGWQAPSRDTAGMYEKEITRTLADVGQYLNMCQIGNEYNLAYPYLDNATVMAEYEAVYFTPGYNSIKLANQIDIAGAGVGLSNVDWMVQTVNSGIYEKEDILATHAYGYPYAPDFSKDPGIELVVESSYARTRSFLDTYGDKTWHVDEVGYPTTAKNSAGITSGCDLRSQADYTVREVILALKYGADVVQVYNIYDQQNLFKGVSPDNQEYNFGLFYYQDYYGRILPKPSAIAFAVMTRQLDNMEACQEIETGSPTVRAFEVTKHGSEEKVIVAWSTCYHISNDIGFDFIRTPNLPWNNQWKETETVSFDCESENVEIVDTMGNAVKGQWSSDGKLQVVLNGSPVFIRCK